MLLIKQCRVFCANFCSRPLQRAIAADIGRTWYMWFSIPMNSKRNTYSVLLSISTFKWAIAVTSPVMATMTAMAVQLTCISCALAACLRLIPKGSGLFAECYGARATHCLRAHKHHKTSNENQQMRLSPNGKWTIFWRTAQCIFIFIGRFCEITPHNGCRTMQYVSLTNSDNIYIITQCMCQQIGIHIHIPTCCSFVTNSVWSNEKRPRIRD